MEEIIKIIQDLFVHYTSLSIEIIDNKKVNLPNLEALDYDFHVKTQKIKKELERIYLIGNDLSLHRIKELLVDLNKNAIETDYGLQISFPQFNSVFYIEAENIKEISIIKLRYLDELIQYINGLIKPKESKDIKANKEKYPAIYYALTYIIELKAKGELLRAGRRNMLEAIGKEMNPNGSGNTFYKNVNRINRNNWTSSKQQLDYYIGDDWEDVILKLTKHPELVKAYIKIMAM